MNKHELKSLLENIYTVLTEENIPDYPPAPANWDTISPDPWPWPPNTISPPPPPPPPPPPKLVYPPLTPLEVLRGQVINDYDQWIEFFGRWIQLYTLTPEQRALLYN